MKGYAGKVLRINLSQRKIRTEDFSERMCREYIGGKGFGAKILYEETTPRTDLYDPSNLLIFATGPLNGITLSGAAKFCAIFKSPLTEIWGESQCSGHFAPQLKFAGHDMVIIQEKSEKPVYIVIEDEKIEIRDATHLRGKDGTGDVVALLPPMEGG